MKAQISSHFERHELLCNTQYGLSLNKSTNDAVGYLTDIIMKGMESGVIFCDVQKAFDCNSHCVLLEKLGYLNFKTLSCRIIDSYLTKCQYTHVNWKNSSLTPVNCGVSQGSILGSTLFVLYMNDFGANLAGSNYVLYADDSTGWFGSSLRAHGRRQWMWFWRHCTVTQWLCEIKFVVLSDIFCWLLFFF